MQRAGGRRKSMSCMANGTLGQEIRRHVCMVVTVHALIVFFSVREIPCAVWIRQEGFHECVRHMPLQFIL